MSSRNWNQDIYNVFMTSHNLPLTSIEKYLQISSNEFWLVVIQIQDIYKCIWDIFKKIQLEISSNEFWLVVIPIQDIYKCIRDISNCILTSQIVFEDILNSLMLHAIV